MSLTVHRFAVPPWRSAYLSLRRWVLDHQRSGKQENGPAHAPPVQVDEWDVHPAEMVQNDRGNELAQHGGRDDGRHPGLGQGEDGGDNGPGAEEATDPG